MSYTIEPIQNSAFAPPPVVPNRVSKAMGFNFLPVGTVRVTDGKTWAVYYNEGFNISYMVYDLGDHWRVKPVLGKVSVSYAKGVMAQKPCCPEG